MPTRDAAPHFFIASLAEGTGEADALNGKRRIGGGRAESE